jgi:hypothetical protein
MGVEHYVFERVADVAEFCEENGLGMDRATVAGLNPYGETLGPERAVS